MPMSCGILSRRGGDLDRPASPAGDHLGNRSKRLGTSAGAIEQARRSVRDHLEEKIDRIVDMQVIAGLFAIAEQRNAPLLERLAHEAVRPVRIVGVAGAINRSQTQDRHGCLCLARQHQLSRPVHDSVEVGRNRRRRLRDQCRRKGVDRIGTGIDELRDFDRTGGLADRPAHGEISHQRAGVAALVGRERRQEHDHVARPQPLGEPRAARGVRQINLARAEPDGFDPRCRADARARPRPRNPLAPSTTTRSGMRGRL